MSDDWDFNVDDEKLKKSHPSKRRRKKASVEINTLGVAKSKQGSGERKSRSRIAKEENQEEFVGGYDAAPLPKRITSMIIDLGITYGLWLGSNLGVGLVKAEYVAKLEELGMDQMLLPAVLDFRIQCLIFIVLAFVICILPNIISNGSIGKRIAGIRVDHIDPLQDYTFGNRFFREVIAKPISIVSVIGILVILIDKNRRSLHDRIAKSCVYRND